MCFSATASFGAGAVLGMVGIMAVSKAENRPQKVFATIPLIFAVQQITEGLLWVSLKDAGENSLRSLLTYIYLVFAMGIWPFWISFTVWLLEEDRRRKKIMNFLVATGTFVAVIVALVLSLYPVEVMTPLCRTCPAVKDHLHYEFAFPATAKKLIGVFTVLYIMATIVTPLISTTRKMKWLGIVFLGSYLFAVIFFEGYVVSVWCFFAALLSFVVLWIITDLKSNKV